MASAFLFSAGFRAIDLMTLYKINQQF